MSLKSSLDKWRFLVGEWKGKAEEQFGEKGLTESVAIFRRYGETVLVKTG